MKQRLLSGWTFTRAIYVIIGLVVIIQSILMKHWFGVAFGTYFASMGLFSFGCASGNCYGGQCESPASKKSMTKLP